MFSGLERSEPTQYRTKAADQKWLCHPVAECVMCIQTAHPSVPLHVPYVRSPARGKFLRKMICFPGNQTTRPSPLPRDERRPMEKLSQGLAKARQLRQMPNLYGKRELLVSRRTRAFRLIFCSVRLYNIIGSEPGIFLQTNGRGGPKLPPIILSWAAPQKELQR